MGANFMYGDNLCNLTRWTSTGPSA